MYCMVHIHTVYIYRNVSHFFSRGGRRGEREEEKGGWLGSDRWMIRGVMGDGE